MGLGRTVDDGIDLFVLDHKRNQVCVGDIALRFANVSSKRKSYFKIADGPHLNKGIVWVLREQLHVATGRTVV
jgi:hypothetical protein